MTGYNDGEWHKWNGGECPIHPKSLVEVKFRLDSDSIMGPTEASKFRWTKDELPGDVVAFRVIDAHQEPCEATE